MLGILKGALGSITKPWKTFVGILLATIGTVALALHLRRFSSARLPVALAATSVFLILLLWLFPKWQVNSLRWLDSKERFDRENEARKTLSQILGGLILLIGFYFTWQNLVLTREGQVGAEKAAQENLRIASEGQITDRFTKAIAQLGDTRLEIRLGGIYALGRIAKDSRKDQPTIMEVLTAYVRENASLKKIIEKPRKSQGLSVSPAPDIAAILDVIGGRTPADEGAVDQQLNLSSTDLRGATLGGADLNRVLFDGADLSGAFLNGAHLSQADLLDADLSEAQLTEADLTEADLTGANLKGADLTKAVRAHARSA